MARSSFLDLAIMAIPIFANDGTMDGRELSQLLNAALEDGVLDEDERRVLKNIFTQVDRKRVPRDVWERISRFREEMKF